MCVLDQQARSIVCTFSRQTLALALADGEQIERLVVRCNWSGTRG